MNSVVDITKGIQTQTAECLVIGEITCGKMLIVLNKIDLVPAEKRLQTIEKVLYLFLYEYDAKLFNFTFFTDD